MKNNKSELFFSGETGKSINQEKTELKKKKNLKKLLMFEDIKFKKNKNLDKEKKKINNELRMKEFEKKIRNEEKLFKEIENKTMIKIESGLNFYNKHYCNYICNPNPSHFYSPKDLEIKKSHRIFDKFTNIQEKKK